MCSIVTLVSAFVIAVLLLGEFLDYRSVHTESSLIVDGGRKAKMAIDFDISFPKIPCYSTFSRNCSLLLSGLAIRCCQSAMVICLCVKLRAEDTNNQFASL